MINSVSGKMESMEAVFPLVRKYGGVVVGLALDENGIPSTAEGRIRIAKKIYDTAEKYGIPHEDIVIDGLAMTISSDSGSALVTLETLRRIRDDVCHTSLRHIRTFFLDLQPSKMFPFCLCFQKDWNDSRSCSKIQRALSLFDCSKIRKEHCIHAKAESSRMLDDFIPMNLEII